MLFINNKIVVTRDGKIGQSAKMAIATESSFDSWLNTKLKSLNTDEGVYGSYIKGILEGDESEDEKTQALEMILESIAVRYFLFKG